MENFCYNKGTKERNKQKMFETFIKIKEGTPMNA